ncbi:AraC family ligand binding domain-containing protein, partial [Acinetobacter baumannii]
MGSMNAIPQTFEFWQDRRMPYVETRRSCFGRTCYKSHSHPTFSIGAIDEGNSVFQSSFGTAQKITAGTLVIVPAHVEHSCN